MAKTPQQSSKSISDSLFKAIAAKLEEFKDYVVNYVSSYRIKADQLPAGIISESKYKDYSISGKKITLEAKESITTSIHNLLNESKGPFTSVGALIKEFKTVSLSPSSQYTIIVNGSVNDGQQIAVKFNDGMDGDKVASFVDGFAVIRFSTPATLLNTNVRLYNSPSITATAATIMWACMYEGSITSPPRDWYAPYEEIDQRLTGAEASLELIPGQITAAVSNATPYEGPTPPEDPTKVSGWINTGVTPPEYLRWTGNSESNVRRYSATKSGTTISIDDLSDIHALGVSVSTVVSQSGSGTPSPANIRAITGHDAVTVTVNTTANTITPTSTLYGLATIEDVITNGGEETHKTGYISFAGTETFTYPAAQPAQADYVRFDYENAYIKLSPILLSSHFDYVSAGTTTYTTDSIMGDTAMNKLYFIIAKSRLTGWTDTWTDTEKIASFKSYLATQTVLETPVQVVYEPVSQSTTVCPTKVINGVDGSNSITTSGSTMTITYQGSGWEVVGGRSNSLFASAEMKFDSNGLEISQTTIDGEAVDVKFAVNTEQCGYYKESDNTFLGGLKVLDNDVYVASSALIDPRQDNKFIIRILNSVVSSVIRDSLAFTYDGSEIGRIEAVVNTASPSYGAISLKSSGGRPAHLVVYDDAHKRIAVDASNDGCALVCWDYDTETGSSFMVCPDGKCYIEGTLTPEANNLYNCGGSGAGFNYYYGAHTSIQSTSDMRAKNDINPVDSEVMMRFIMNLEPMWYRLNDAPEDLMAGFIAQSFRDAMIASGIPEDFAGFNGKDAEHFALDYCQVIAPLVCAVQSQQKTIEFMQAKLDEQESLISSLASSISRIEANLYAEPEVV